MVTVRRPVRCTSLHIGKPSSAAERRGLSCARRNEIV